MRRRLAAATVVGVMGILLLVGAIASFMSGVTVPDVVRKKPTSLALGPQFELVRTLGDPADTGRADWPGIFDTRPKAFDFDGDGVDEIVGMSNDTHVYVFDVQSGAILARLPTKYPQFWQIDHVLNGVEAAVLRPGEPPSIIVGDGAAYVTVWRFNEAASGAASFQFDLAWERRMDECFQNPGMDASPTLHDLDADGALEILVQTEEVGFFVLDAAGETRWGKCWGGGNAEPLVADLDGDGTLEAVFTSDAGLVSVLDARIGTPKWSFNAADPRYGISPGSIPVGPTVAELDGKSPKELLFTARNAPSGDPAKFPDYHMGIFAIHLNRTTGKGDLLWMRQPSWAHPLSYTHLIAEDLDGDGATDILGMDWNTIGHNPGNWQNLGPAHVFRLNARGEDVWVRTMDVWWSNKEILLADTDGDGARELIVNGARPPSDGIWRLSLKDGQPIGYVPLTPWKLLRGPILAELHHDGRPFLVVPIAPQYPPDHTGGLRIYAL